MPAETSPLAPVDVLVVGGGPAGLSAAVALARSLRSVLVVDSGTPRNATAAGVHNYLGREGVRPADLLADGRTTLVGYGGRVEDGEVVRLETLGQEAGSPWFRASFADGRAVDARRVVVTTGLVDRLPDVPGLAGRWGRDVLHCPYCHGYEARGTAIGVLSTTPLTTHQALMFRQLSDDVTLLTHTGPHVTPDDRERLAARGVRLVDGEVAEVLVTDDALSGVRLASGEVVPLQNLAIAAPAVSRSALLADLGVEVADFTVAEHVLGAYAVSEPTGATSVPGLFVAGNVTTVQAQVATSVAAGLMTGAFVNGTLIEEETTQAVADRRRNAEFWDERYAPSGPHDHTHGDGGHPRHPNPTLVAVASDLAPGTALDLGTGRGDDVFWLGRQGWDVLGADVSGVVVAQATAEAAERGLADRVRFEQHDLSGTFPAGRFDLVTTHYLHSTVGLPREDVLRRATGAVAPGGTLLVVGHATLPPWAWRDLDDRARDLPSPAAVVAALRLDQEWEVLRADVAPRSVTGPDGEQASMDDSVVVARRRR